MFLVLLAFLIILAADLPALLRSKNKRDLIIYCILFLMVGTVSVVRSLGIQIPSILMIMGEAMTRIGWTY